MQCPGSRKRFPHRTLHLRVLCPKRGRPSVKLQSLNVRRIVASSATLAVVLGAASRPPPAPANADASTGCDPGIVHGGPSAYSGVDREHSPCRRA